MRYDWDPAKAASNLAKHGVAFDAVDRFQWETAIPEASLFRGEPRLTLYGLIGERLHVLVISTEARSIRVISLRKANDREVKRWYARS